MRKRDTRYNKEQYSESSMLPKHSGRKSDYGWNKDWKEMREEKDEWIFFQVVKKIRNEYQPILNLLKEKQGNIIDQDGKMMYRYAEYFKEMLNNELEDENDK